MFVFSKFFSKIGFFEVLFQVVGFDGVHRSGNVLNCHHQAYNGPL
ncbi:hypothetical protein imdm_187 [gamma proteobacterium IMCC2047]|nr:hypothetical protein imdm_187 [gamma proteobacterium IMCC2047]